MPSRRLPPRQPHSFSRMIFIFSSNSRPVSAAADYCPPFLFDLRYFSFSQTYHSCSSAAISSSSTAFRAPRFVAAFPRIFAPLFSATPEFSEAPPLRCGCCCPLAAFRRHSAAQPAPSASASDVRRRAAARQWSRRVSPLSPPALFALPPEIFGFDDIAATPEHTNSFDPKYYQSRLPRADSQFRLLHIMILSCRAFCALATPALASRPSLLELTILFISY